MDSSRKNGSRTLLESLEPRLLLAYTRFAVIGDFSAGQPLLDVSNVIKSWNPNFIATVGDNNYEVGSASTIDQNIGQYFHNYIYPYTGSYGAGSVAGNRFFPALGNHDYGTANAQPYLNYFTLPGNERYYSTLQGNTQLFIVNSNPEEPDGTGANSTQALWLRDSLASSRAVWKIVLFHHAAYSSGEDHGNTPYMQWPFKQWGATAVIGGHDHDYERLNVGGLPYFVNGLGGKSLYTFSDPPVSGSQFRYNADYGAMRVDAFDQSITFRFINRVGTVIDTYTLNAPTSASNDLVRAGDTWKYLANGSNQGTAWRGNAFNDAAWSSGAAQLGYGDGDEITTVPFGPNSSNKYTTTYFRKSFLVGSPSNFTSLTLELLRDDGAVVYLNGAEVFRSNMPTGTIAYNTFAASNVSDPQEDQFYTTTLTAASLVAGTNVIAVEIHQSVPDSSDISFDLRLTGTVPASLPRPATPVALRATTVSSSRIDLSWIDASTNESGFRIERSTNGTTFTQIAELPAGSQGYQATGLSASTQYWFRVRAFNDAGDSVAGPVSATTSAPLFISWWNRPPSLSFTRTSMIDLLREL